MKHTHQHTSNVLDKEKDRLFNRLVFERTMQTSEYGRMAFVAVATAVSAFLVPIAAVLPLVVLGGLASAAFGFTAVSRNKTIDETKSKLEGLFIAEFFLARERELSRPATKAAPGQDPVPLTFAERVKKEQQTGGAER